MSNIIREDKTDWAGKYAALQAALKVPGITGTLTKSIQFIYREPVVDMVELLKKVNGLAQKPGVIFVMADVVYMPKNWDMMNQAYIIMARRIINHKDTSVIEFDLHGANVASLSIYANDIVGNIAAVMTYNGGTKIIRTEGFPGIGFQFSRETTGHLRLKHLYNKDLLPFTSAGKQEHVTAELQMSLSGLFQMASVMMDSDSDTARAVLDWIKTATTNSAALQDLYIQSSTLLAELTLEASKVNFVPVLCHEIYKNLADSYLTVVKDYEVQYLRFVDDSYSKADKIKAGQQMLTYFKTTTNFTNELIKQAESNVNAAQEGLKSVEKSMEAAALASKIAGTQFKIGMDLYIHYQKVQAAFDICKALVSFGVVVGKMCVGDASAVADAGGAVAAAGNAVAAGAKAGKELSAFAKAMENLEKSMMSLKHIGRLLSGTATFIEKIKAAAEKAGKADSITDLAIPSSDNISGQAEWDIFRLQSDDMLKLVEELGVGGAQEYRQSLDIVSIYGKAQTAAQSSLLLVTQELARLYMQKAANLTMEASVTKYLAELNSDINADQKAAHDVFVLQMNMKRFMFNAIRSYTRAYKYWALKDSEVKPTLLKSAIDLQRDMATIQRDYFNALTHFRGALQDFGLNDGGVEIEITDPAIINAFKETGVVNITIPADSPAFEGMDRVRLRKTRAWIYGLPAKKKVRLAITNSGVYADRYNKRAFTFSSSPSAFAFRYHEEPGNMGGVETDGGIIEDMRALYFEPTPFTEWRISMPAADPKLDRVHVTKITLRFVGIMIPDLEMARMLRSKAAAKLQEEVN